jgi:MraZ protein
MFSGRSKHTLDEKGRLAIPTRFLDEIKQAEGSCLVVTNYIDCLWGFTDSEWKRILGKVEEMSLMDEAVDNFLRFFISGAQACEVKKGRITIPSELREEAGLNRDIVVAGLVKRFEIWDKDKWDEALKRSRTSFNGTEVRQAIKALGL